jgi:hypothetical protein
MARRKGLIDQEIQDLLENSDSDPDISDEDEAEEQEAEVTSVREYRFQDGQFLDMVVLQRSPDRM